MINFGFYLVIAISGYISSFSDTAKIVLERITIDGKADYACLVAIFGVLISIQVAYPCGYNPARAQMCLMLYGTEEFSKKTNVIMTVTWVVLSWLIAVLFPQIDKVISILGGLCASTLSYVLPTFCWVVLSKKPWHAPTNFFPILIFGGMACIGYASVFLTIFLGIVGCEKMRDFNDGTC